MDDIEKCKKCDITDTPLAAQYGGDCLWCVVERLAAENERLRAALDTARVAEAEAMSVVLGLEGTVERLREELDELADDTGVTEARQDRVQAIADKHRALHQLDKLGAECDRLRGERDEARALLREIEEGE